jgi:Tol biopolymer transport system component/pimeloyl-ACP methyl ester carboxylesterase
VDSAGNQANGPSDESAISADGRYVAFVSEASNLVPGDTNACFPDYDCPDVFVHDRQTGVTERVSVDSAGNQTNSESHSPAINADGRYIAFGSYATNLVPNDTNDCLDPPLFGCPDVFVHDRQTGVTERVSVDSVGAQANDYSAEPAISADGRYVAFWSLADNLVPGDTNGSQDVFVHDRQTGTTERVSVDNAGNQADSASESPEISSDGRYVAFASWASNLVPGDTNGQEDIFVHDRQTGATERVSVDSSGNQATSNSYVPAISANGRYVAFACWDCNLVSGDTNSTFDVFVHDRQTGTTERVSVDSAGTQGNWWSDWPTISADGRYVAFVSLASNLVPEDTNGNWDIFIHDRATGATERVSVNSSGEQADNGSQSRAAISADGRYVAFSSWASNLVPGDTGYKDVFVRDRCPDGSCVAPPALERAVIFIQGIDSLSGECGETFRGDVDWMRQFLTTQSWVTDRVNLDPARSFAYFNYAGTYPNTYCNDSYSQPDYGAADTCSGVAVAAEKLDVLIDWMLVAEGAQKVDLVAHSMGGMVAAYWLRTHEDMRPKVNSIVTFDSPLSGLFFVPPSPPSACGPGSQSIDDLSCHTPGSMDDCESNIVPAIATMEGEEPVPFFTIDATHPDPVGTQYVPSERTTLLLTNSALHCQFDDDHGSAWRQRGTGNDLVKCWESMRWPPASGPALLTPDFDSKATLVGCAVASLSASECIAKIGAPYEPPAVLPGPSPAGSTELPVASDPFSVGNHIAINPGMPNEEENEVIALGSIILASPLQFDHEAGEPVVILADSPAVGGIADIPDIPSSSGPNQVAFIGAFAAAVAALIAGGLYARRRWLR